MDDDIPYLLLTPGPLTTSRTVRQAMQFDYSTWDADYNQLVQFLRERLVQLASAEPRRFTCVPMQGSGTFAVEAALGSLVPPDGKILIVNNGAYGARMVQIADRLRIHRFEVKLPETVHADVDLVRQTLREFDDITHVAMVHCETTTGLLNPAAEVGMAAREFGKVFVVDAMSSFGGIPLSMESLGADCLISSANKCIQGVPGFGFVIVERNLLSRSRGWARSLSLDLHDQWREMEDKGGKWRFTSPTHCVCAFVQALKELDEEGGVAARHRRYSANRDRLVAGMEAIGYRTLLLAEHQSPIITSFLFPPDPKFSFPAFYAALKARRFVLYPGKVSDAETFRIGTIGHVFPVDIDELVRNIGEVTAEQRWRT